MTAIRNRIAIAMSKPTLQLTPPKDLFTMPDARVWHYITDDQVELIKVGTRDRFWDFMLAALGCAIGLAQNPYSLLHSWWYGNTMQGGEYFGTLLFAVSLTAAVCFWLIARSKTDPLQNMVREIESRQLQEGRVK